MIEFSCQQCGRGFAVPDGFAGRAARCKSCGTQITVPHPRSSNPLAGVNGAKLSMRQRRLMADAAQMDSAFAQSEIIAVKSRQGDPPDVYEIEYFIQSLDRDKSGKPIPRSKHAVEIRLTTDYPRFGPKCKMLTPIFHPNIDPATICVGDHWTAGERLVDLVVRIGEMIAYQAYNIRSPLDGEAAMWADLNPDKLPTDARLIRPTDLH